MDDTNVLFSAEFAGDGIKKGTDELLQNLERMKKVEGELKATIAENTAELKKNEKALEALNKQHRVTINPDFQNHLKKEIDILNQRNRALKESSNQSTVFLNRQKAEIKDQSKVLNEMKKDTEAVGKAINNFTSVNKLAAQGIGQLRGQVVTLATSFVGGLAGGLISAVIPALVDTIQKMFGVGGALNEMERRQKVVNEIQDKAVSGYINQTTRLELLRQKLNDVSLPEKERLKILTEYNKLADKGNQIDKLQINNLDLVNEKITAQIDLLKKRALARAAENIIAERAEKLIKAQIEFDAKNPGDPSKDILTQFRGRREALEKMLEIRLLKTGGSIFENIRNQQILDLFSADEDFNTALAAGLELIDVDSLTTKPGKDKSVKTIENVFIQKLAELKARLAAAAASSFQSEELIRDKFEAQLNKEFIGIEKLLKDKKLTGPQADILKGLLGQINETEMSKSLDEFRKKQTDAMNKINEIIASVAVESGQKRIAGIRDQFEREKEEIEFGYQRTVETLRNSLKKVIDQVNDDVKKGLISPKDGKKSKFLANIFFGDLMGQAKDDEMRKGADLAFKIFQQTLQDASVTFEQDGLLLSEKVTAQLQEETQKFLQGSIKYEQYQKNVTRILKEESQKRRRLALSEAEEQLRLIQFQLGSTTDIEQKKRLEEQERQARERISQLRRDISSAEAGENKDDNKRFKKLFEYVKAVQTVLESVLSFWQQVNQAEAASLDRSIALQERRVANAREVAEAGNAEFLEMEQKRLDELERKRADNARKQIAINNALTLSQATVAAVTAIAQAVASGSALAAFGAVAAVIAAIGAAFAFVNSLQPQEASFFKGKEYVDGEGRAPMGVDTIPAKLHLGERVVTAKDNKEYWAALSAIHNHQIPPDVLNTFVEGYTTGSIPAVDYARLSVATTDKIGDHETLNKLEKLNGTMQQVVHGISKLGIHVNMDEDGLSVAITRAERKRKLRKRA